MTKELKNLVEISNYFGKNPEYVIAGGGNTSYKNNQFLWIKASGTSLATITEEGFVRMDRNCLQKISEKTYSNDPLQREAEIKTELYSCIAEDSDKRPSVETSLHNLLKYDYIVHTHPTWVNALMCSMNCRDEILKLFGRETLLIEYTDPGYVLFKLVEKKVAEYRAKFYQEPKVIFLENHGVFVSSNTVDEIESIYRNMEKRIKDQALTRLPSTDPVSNQLAVVTEPLAKQKNKVVKAFNNELIQHFVTNEAQFRNVGTAFTPDNIVYCKAYYLFSEPDTATLLKKYELFEKQYGYPPRVIGIEKEGIVCLEDSEKSLNIVYEVFLDMLKIAYISDYFGGPRCMTPWQIEFIDNWEVENYRRKVAR